MLGDGPVVRVSVLDAGDVNPIPDVLHAGHQDAADQEDDARHSVMELRDDALCLGVSNLYKMSQYP